MKRPQTEKSYIQIFQSGLSESGRTVISTVATNAGTPLGEIKWMPRWRQYAFFLYKNTWLSPGCMEEISDKINELNEARKRGMRVNRQIKKEI